jgi:hypothetical protein
MPKWTKFGPKTAFSLFFFLLRLFLYKGSTNVNYYYVLNRNVITTIPIYLLHACALLQNPLLSIITKLVFEPI